MQTLDQKINKYFPGLVVRKDLVNQVKGNAIVPSYVLEYLLGQYCATDDEDSIQSGIETVRGILARHYVHRNEAGLIRSTIREKGRHKVIDKISVDLNEKKDVYEATFGNLGIKQVLVGTDVIKRHPKLLVSGVWCIADIEYFYTEDRDTSPWILDTIKPIQLSHFDFQSYLAARREFSTDEWIDLLIQSIGFNPEMFGRRSKLTQLLRLIPYCERNYNIIELGPKGTGKSHIYSEFSPHGILISGGEVTVAKLFVNNASGRIGLVGYWDTVAFDEFAGKQKRVDKALVDILKNYMANKSFSRGIETLGAEASMAFVGNTQHTLPYMLRNSDLFTDLPDKFYDSAFLDRVHFYVPGWEVDIIRGEMFTDGYGFVVDYLAEILRYLRNEDFSYLYDEQFELLEDISTRDRTGIRKSFSGLMKILFPHQEATRAEMEDLLRFAIEGRKRVKDQLLRIDATYADVRFGYRDLQNGGKVSFVKTLEEEQYPKLYYRGDVQPPPADTPVSEPITSADPAADDGPQPGHRVIKENARGISYDALFGDYLKGANKIEITDPYLRNFKQVRNLMELMETIVRVKDPSEEVAVHVVTTHDEFNTDKQIEFFEQIEKACISVGIQFSMVFDPIGKIHARHIITDTGWKILLDRGLDIWQFYEMNDAFSFQNRLQQERPCRNFEITYLRMND